MSWQDFWYELETGRLRIGWRVPAFLCVALAMSAVCFVVLAMIAQAVGIDWQHHELLALAIQYLASLPGVLVASVWAVHALDKLPVRSLGLGTDWRWMRSMLLGLGIGFALIALLVAVLWAFGMARVSWQSVDGQAVLLLLGIAGILLVAGAFEELLLRGYLFQTLLRGIGPLATLLFTSALFASMHLGNPGVHLLAVANIFLAGVLFGLLYLRLGSLAVPIGMHAGWNLAQAVLGMPISGLTLDASTPVTTTLLGSFLFAGGKFGIEGTVSASVLLLGLIAVLAYTRRGLPLHARWWEWREALSRPSLPPPWDFSLGTRYYQWKLQYRDSTE